MAASSSEELVRSMTSIFGVGVVAASSLIQRSSVVGSIPIQSSSVVRPVDIFEDSVTGTIYKYLSVRKRAILC